MEKLRSENSNLLGYEERERKKGNRDCFLFSLALSLSHFSFGEREMFRQSNPLFTSWNWRINSVSATEPLVKVFQCKLPKWDIGQRDAAPAPTPCLAPNETKAIQTRRKNWNMCLVEWTAREQRTGDDGDGDGSSDDGIQIVTTREWDTVRRNAIISVFDSPLSFFVVWIICSHRFVSHYFFVKSVCVLNAVCGTKTMRYEEKK